MNSQFRILHIDQCLLVRNGLASILLAEMEMQISGISADSNSLELTKLWHVYRPDLIIIDPGKWNKIFITKLRQLSATYSESKVLILSDAFSDVDIKRLHQAGAAGHLSKLSQQQKIIDVVRQVLDGKKYFLNFVLRKQRSNSNDVYLTLREKEILEQVCKGERNKTIAECLNISEWTVKSHVKNILTKLKAENRTEAVSIGVKEGFIGIS